MSSRWLFRLVPARPARRKKRNVLKGYQPAYVELLENRLLLSSQNVLAQTLVTLPGTNFEDIPVQFDLTKGRDRFAEVGIFVFDANGTVGGQLPGGPGFEQAVLNSGTRQVLFGPGTSPANSVTIPLVGGSQIGVYFRLKAGPAMPHEFLVRTTSSNTLRIGFEEMAPLWPGINGGDSRRFDDAIIDVTLGNGVRLPVPTLAPIANRTIPETQPFQLTVTATNPSGPPFELRYQIDQGPMGLSINANTGVLTWTPGEGQGPGRYDVVVRVFNSRRPASFSTQRFIIDVTELNAAPIISAISDQTAFQGQRVSFVVQATDPDQPAFPSSQLTFSLVNNTIANATIDPQTGRFGWTPLSNDAPGLYEFTVRVQDEQGLFDLETFTIQVLPFP